MIRGGFGKGQIHLVTSNQSHEISPFTFISPIYLKSTG
jgi:hypothetical protein